MNGQKGGSFLWWQGSFQGGMIEITRGTVVDTIRITASASALLAMDSGVVDLKGYAPNDPARYFKATLGNTTSTLAYSAGYALSTPTAKSKTKPATVPYGQMLGTVTLPPFAGHVIDGAAPSFSQNKVSAPTLIDNPQNEALANKKSVAAACPASIFTGRTRMYVQALYGRPLYAAPETQGALPSYFPALGGGGGTPTLTLQAFKRSDDTVQYAPVTVDTSTGLCFIAATGAHFLITVGVGGLTVYPLKSSAAGEAARKFLTGIPANKGSSAPLSPADTEKLEAFILSYSLPDVKNAFIVPLGVTSGGYGMGYGWHWNWSGTAADIVTMTTFNQPPINSGAQFQAQAAMESTYRRITVSISSSGVWTGSNTVLEGPVRWAVHRGYWCIAEPVWGTLSMAKTTPRNSTLFNCDAPFYVFYNRDAVQLCRVKVDQKPNEPANRTMSYLYASAGYQGAIDELTCGLLDGFVNDKTVNPAAYKATFSCGGVVYADLTMPQAFTEAVITLKKGAVTYPPTNFNNTSGFGVTTINYGYPAPWNGSPGYSTILIQQSLPEYYGLITIAATRTAKTRSTTRSSTATLIVPLFDAQAIFMEGTNYENVADSNVVITTHASLGAWGECSGAQVLVSHNPDGTPNYLATPPDEYPKWSAGYNGAALTTNNPAPSSVENDTPKYKLVGLGGALDVVMADLGSFHDNSLDAPTVNYGALSGASATSPVVISQGRLVPAAGVVDAVPTNPALVGWV